MSAGWQVKLGGLHPTVLAVREEFGRIVKESGVLVGGIHAFRQPYERGRPAGRPEVVDEEEVSAAGRSFWISVDGEVVAGVNVVDVPDDEDGEGGEWCNVAASRRRGARLVALLVAVSVAKEVRGGVRDESELVGLGREFTVDQFLDLLSTCSGLGVVEAEERIFGN